MHLSSKNEKMDVTDKSVLTMLVKNASSFPENTTTLGGRGKETREPEAITGSTKTVTAAMKGSLKNIGAWRRMKMKLEERLRKPERLNSSR